jgi:outer membrane lipoprotein carrier protein
LAKDYRVARQSLFSIVALAIMCQWLPAAAQSIDDAGEALVNDFVDNVVTLQGRFEQSRINADREVQDFSSGTFEIDRPGRFRWLYAEPYEQWLVADGLNVWSYDVDLAQVTVKPQAEALANTPALLLGGGADALSQFRFDGSFAEQGTTWVRMVPVDTSSGFERMELGFVGGELSRMVFFDNLEQTTIVALYEVTVNEPIDDARFVFVVPEDADLVGVPATAEASSP